MGPFAACAGARRSHALPLLARRIVERHLVVSTAMGNRRAAESGEDDLRENPAVVRAVHRQAGDELLGARGGEAKIPQLLGAPRRLARRLHRREQQCCVTDRQDLLLVEQLAEYCRELVAIPNVRNAFPAKKLLDALTGNSRPLEEGRCRLPVA
jgi:hypothetical protein